MTTDHQDRQRQRQRQSILHASRFVRRGEFTSYSDISWLVYGHGLGGQAVGIVAMRDPDFPNPHRILAKGGLIPASWMFPDGTGSRNDAEGLLRKEGIEILHDENGYPYAHPRHYVNHVELDARRKAAL